MLLAAHEPSSAAAMKRLYNTEFFFLFFRSLLYSDLVFMTRRPHFLFCSAAS
jgi:hypothetical protein